MIMGDSRHIVFGTDGWRAVIADGFTFGNLGRVAEATATWMLRQYGGAPDSMVRASDREAPGLLTRTSDREAPRAVIGYDTRFMSHAFAEHVACVLAARGVEVLLADSFTPTPAVSWVVTAYGCDVGIVITASHNPPEYSGFKLKADFGGPAFPAMIAGVEAEIGRVQDRPVNISTLPSLGGAGLPGGIREMPVTEHYLDHLARREEVAAIRSSGLRVVHDAMFGSGQGLLTKLLGSERVVEIRCALNPGFQGQGPEPMADRLGLLSEVVVAEGCHAGVAHDGDADRIGMVDERGRFVDAHTIMALLVHDLHTRKGLTGTLVKSFSVTSLIDRMGEAYGLPVETTPIGFKHLAARIVGQDVLVGGEESGGIYVRGHILDRDGVYVGLLLLDVMLRRGRSLSELVAELHERFGPHVYRRMDLRTTDAVRDDVVWRLRQGKGLRAIDGAAVRHAETLDGFKHHVDHGWLMVRPSGTEPVLRLYAEAESGDRAESLIRDAADQLGLEVAPGP